MEKRKITKLFFAWQDEKEQTWLEQMAAHGWILDEVVFICYTFRKEEPQQICYRLDYQEIKQNELQDYLGLFADAGWQYKGRVNNWFYFASKGNEAKEIYTDIHSKVQKYKRVLRMCAIACFPITYSLISFSRLTEQAAPSSFYVVMEILQFLIFFFALLLVFNIIRLAIRINKMEKGL